MGNHMVGQSSPTRTSKHVGERGGGSEAVHGGIVNTAGKTPRISYLVIKEMIEKRES